MRRLAVTLPAALLGLLLAAAPTLACGGLIGPNGAVNLLRTTTFAGYHDGEEHYVTAFQFAGGGGSFGSITPLPGHPERGREGRRLDAPAPHPRDRPRSTSSPPRPSARQRRPTLARGAHEGPHRRPGRDRPPGRRRRHRRSGPRTTASASRPTPPRCSTSTRAAARSSSPRRSTPTRPRSGASSSATGPRSTSRSPPTTRGSRSGSSPWARRARSASRPTCSCSPTRVPALLPAPDGDHGMRLDHSAAATTSLLDDLRSDRGMEWIPSEAWLTKVAIDADAAEPRRTTSRSTPAGRAPRRRWTPASRS